MLKGRIRQSLENKYRKRYRSLLQQKTVSYDEWIRGKEADDCLLEEKDEFSPDRGKEKEKIAFFSFEQLKEGESLWRETKAGIICFVEEIGRLRKKAAKELCGCFEKEDKLQVAYGDEDEWDTTKEVRVNPWFKPDYSPDTLLSWFYFGSLVAFRRESLEGVVLKPKLEPKKQLYALTLQVCMPLASHQVCHLKEILTTSRKIVYWGFEEEYAGIREEARRLCLRKEVRGVSIIIPSKDNPVVLKQCLESIKRYTKDYDYELIVVDNGSSGEALTQVERLKERYGFTWLYQPMEFNFSRMCNLGARESKKDLLLFLNDDCEAIQPGWLEQLADQTALSRAGAVGAKLYYPDSRMLQHCGVYGTYLGPVHKLQFKNDSRIYSDRRNRDVRNVMAVTAACLMVRKEVFLHAGGFDEKLKVAFNDVDFCWRLHELGYQNIIHNEVCLWHHESLSRGSDETPEKKLRFKGEQKRLFEKHSHHWDKDPYYHENFISRMLDLNFSFIYEYDSQVDAALIPKEMKKWPKKLREDRCVAPLVEFAGKAEDWFLFEREKEGKENQLYMQGTVMVLGADNACYKTHILLIGDKGRVWRISPGRRRRQDVVVNVPDQINVDLSGFASLVEVHRLPEGVYEIAFLMKDRCSRQYLLRKIGWRLNLPGMEDG